MTPAAASSMRCLSGCPWPTPAIAVTFRPASRPAASASPAAMPTAADPNSPLSDERAFRAGAMVVLLHSTTTAHEAGGRHQENRSRCGVGWRAALGLRGRAFLGNVAGSLHQDRRV